MNDALPFLGSVRSWAERHPEVRAVALVGSYAGGEADEESDIDLVVLTEELHAQLGDRSWLSEFGVPATVAVEQWGMITSLRVRYREGSEVEFGIGPLRWAAAEPVDPGTASVVVDGFRILYDPDGLPSRLARSVR